MRSRPFPARVRALREAHGLRQFDLARQLGLARQGYWSNLEQGRKAPSLELVVRIADFFGVSTDELLREQPLVVGSGIRAATPPTGPTTSPRLFGAKLRQLREHRGLVQEDLVQPLEISGQGYISNLETGKRAPSLELVIRVAEFFEVSTDYLLRDTIPIEQETA